MGYLFEKGVFRFHDNHFTFAAVGTFRSFKLTFDISFSKLFLVKGSKII